jgi:riboflavin synthase
MHVAYEQAPHYRLKSSKMVLEVSLTERTMWTTVFEETSVEEDEKEAATELHLLSSSQQTEDVEEASMMLQQVVQL